VSQGAYSGVRQCLLSSDLSSVCIVVAHPDDETLGCGGLCQRVSSTVFIHATDGVPGDSQFFVHKGFGSAEAYRRRRVEELDHALARLPSGRHKRIMLGLGDQELLQHIPGLVRLLTDHIRSSGANAIVTHAFEGGHPDHDVVAFCAATAARQLGDLPVFEMPLYRAERGRTALQSFPDTSLTTVETLTLTPEEVGIKKQMLRCFSSQQRLTQRFAPAIERFRAMPDHDFSLPPNGGDVLYDRFSWQVTSAMVTSSIQRYLEGQ